jgi:phosphate transport system substrate-binding protein
VQTLNKMKKEFKIWQIIIPVLFATGAAGIILSCTGRGSSTPQETTTSGNIKIEADESFEPIVDSQVAVFTKLYNQAHITPEYKAEADIINDFMIDSVNVIITSWSLTDDQMKILKAKLLEPRTTKIAYDALALIINKKNYDSLLTYQNIENLFKGTVTNWKQINPESKLGDIHIIFDSDKSGNIRYFKDKFKLAGSLPSNFYAVKSNPEVVDYVSKSPNAIGIVSVNWISDHEDSLSMSFVNKIRTVGVSGPYVDTEYFYPLQGSMYDKSYPFTREVNMISRETFYGLGSGFIAFVASEQGQRIVLKAGLLPATMPIRVIQVIKQ